MSIDSLQALATLVLALSAANERLVEAIKTLFAPWLAKERTTADGTVDPVKDRWRQLCVQLVSILSAWVIAAWVVASPDGGLAFGGHFVVGTGAAARQVPAFIVALLTTGGSSFWNSILDFTRDAAKLRAFKGDVTRRVKEGKLPILAQGAPAGGPVAPVAVPAPAPGGMAPTPVVALQL